MEGNNKNKYRISRRRRYLKKINKTHTAGRGPYWALGNYLFSESKATKLQLSVCVESLKGNSPSSDFIQVRHLKLSCFYSFFSLYLLNSLYGLLL